MIVLDELNPMVEILIKRMEGTGLGQVDFIHSGCYVITPEAISLKVGDEEPLTFKAGEVVFLKRKTHFGATLH